MTEEPVVQVVTWIPVSKQMLDEAQAYRDAMDEWVAAGCPEPEGGWPDDDDDDDGW